MATQDLRVRVKAEIGAFQRDMAAVVTATKKAGSEAEKAGKAAESGIGRLAQTAQKHEQAWDQVSTGLVAGGAAIVAGLALATKGAMDWESAWAGVTKTVDGSPQQMAQLESELRGLAKTLPSTHTEIAAVAEAAGQLGVARDDVSGFTKTMIDLGESTNLTAEEAATNIAQISNVMGTMDREGSKGVERFGSALVALGNDGASTEADILSMAQRIAGAGASLNASEADLLALSNTLASMGVRAELGGGVATRVLLKMRTAVDEGGESLESFADVAGTSAEEFATKFSSSPMEALQLVAAGISRTNDAGGNLTATLKDMGIKGTEEMQVMLALANSGDLLTESLELGAKAWSENTALVEEASKRYETTESRIKIAWNNIKDAAIEAGAVILPAVAGISDVIADLAGWFSELPGPVQTALTSMAGIAGVGLLAAGGFMKIVGALGDTIPKMQALGIDTPRATRAVSTLGKALGGITAVGAGLLIGKTAIEAINDAARSGKPDLEEYFNILATGGNLSDTLDFDLSSESFVFPNSAVDSLKEYYGAHTEGAAAAKRALEFSGQNTVLQWFGENLGMGDVRDAADDWLELAKAGEAIARSFEMGESDLGIDALQSLQSELELTDHEVAKLIDGVPELKSALTNLATEQGLQIDPNDELGLVDLAMGRIKLSAPEAAAGTQNLTTEITELGGEAEDTAESFDQIITSLVLLGEINRDAQAAADAHKGAIHALGESITQNGRTLDENTEKGRANRAAMREVADTAWASAEAYSAQGAAASIVKGELESGYETLLKNADAMGMGTKEAEAYARQIMGIPDDVKVDTWMSETAKIMAEATAASIEAMPGYKKVAVAVSEDGTVGQVQSKIDSVTGKTEYVFVTDDGTIRSVQTGIANIDGKNVPVYVGDDGTVYSTQGKIDGIDGKSVTIVADAATGAAEAALNNAARTRIAYIQQRVVNGGSQVSTGRGGRGGQTVGGFTGGIVGSDFGYSLPGLADGGRLPYTGLGTDMIIGIGSHGLPTAHVDDGEWVIREPSANKFNSVLSAINADAPSVQGLAGYAGGGQLIASTAATSSLPDVRFDYGRLAQAMHGQQIDLTARTVDMLARRLSNDVYIGNESIAKANRASNQRSTINGRF